VTDERTRTSFLLTALLYVIWPSMVSMAVLLLLLLLLLLL
jgi:hypothetical protein